MTDKDLRRKWRRYHEECSKAHEAWRDRDYSYPPPASIPFPDELRNLTCGARTRAGTPCKRKDLYLNGRCKLHGGLSTGPTTEEGKRKAALNGLNPKRRKRTS